MNYKKLKDEMVLKHRYVQGFTLAADLLKQNIACLDNVDRYKTIFVAVHNKICWAIGLS